MLIGGDPGIGKSTLLLKRLRPSPRTSEVLYVSGEESGEQVALRARRLGLATGSLPLLAEINLEAISLLCVPNCPASRSSTRSRRYGRTP